MKKKEIYPFWIWIRPSINRSYISRAINVNASWTYKVDFADVSINDTLWKSANALPSSVVT